MARRDVNSLYFGDTEFQAKLVRDVSDSAVNAPGGTYLVTGGTHSGKTTAIREIQKNLERQGFEHPDDPAELLRAKYAPMWKALEEVGEAKGKKLEDSTTIYRRGDNTVIFIHELHSNERMKVAQRLESVVKGQERLPPHPALTIVVDNPIVMESPLPDMQREAVGVEAAQKKQAFETVAQSHPNLKIIHMPYSREQVKAEIGDVLRYSPAELHLALGRNFGVDTEKYSMQDILDRLGITQERPGRADRLLS